MSPLFFRLRLFEHFFPWGDFRARWLPVCPERQSFLLRLVIPYTFKKRKRHQHCSLYVPSSASSSSSCLFTSLIIEIVAFRFCKTSFRRFVSDSLFRRFPQTLFRLFCSDVFLKDFFQPFLRLCCLLFVVSCFFFLYVVFCS